MISAYPLVWPEGWKRQLAARRVRAKFGKGVRQYSSSPGGSSWTVKTDLSVTDGTQRILEELQRMGVERQDVVISTNVRLRLDGLPRSGEREPEDPGVAVYWTDTPMGNEPRCMAIDLYDRVADNLAAVAATLDAMRAIERHGGAQILDRAFKGFTALPAPGQTSRGWREVLNVDGLQVASMHDVDFAYKLLRSRNHPDKCPGDPEAAARFDEIQKAYEQAKAELGQ